MGRVDVALVETQKEDELIKVFTLLDRHDVRNETDHFAVNVVWFHRSINNFETLEQWFD
jgi:hypothetical protein